MKPRGYTAIAGGIINGNIITRLLKTYSYPLGFFADEMYLLIMIKFAKLLIIYVFMCLQRNYFNFSILKIPTSKYIKVKRSLMMLIMTTLDPVHPMLTLCQLYNIYRIIRFVFHL